MLAQYHITTTRQVLGDQFDATALRQVLRANISQDSWWSLLGPEAERHFCDPNIAHSWRYVEAEHATIAQLATTPGQENRQRQALGRLLHTVQDFYAHTNYVTLWLRAHGGADQIDTEAMDGLDPHFLTHPRLRVGSWVLWRELLYYTPWLGAWLRRVWLAPDSHAALNLDSPARGHHFFYALTAARQRTHQEYQRALDAIYRAGGHTALARFHGSPAATASRVPRPSSLQITPSLD